MYTYCIYFGIIVMNEGDIMKLTRDVVNEISTIKGEPEWMKEFRLNAFECFSKLDNPNIKGFSSLIS